MIVLSIRTDKPEAEIGLFEDDKQLAYETWPAHRQLSSTIHSKIAELLKTTGLDWRDLGGVVCFRGPGSFTGLRIGITVANTLAVTLDIPIVGTSGENWLKDGLAKVKKGQSEQQVIPYYGRDPHITAPKK